MSSTSNWQPLGEVYQCRNTRLYESMRWGADVIDFQDAMIAAAPSGGPIAIARDPSKMTVFRQGKEVIWLYTAAGKALATVPVSDAGGRLLHLGWSSSELLYAVYTNGTVDVWEPLGNRSDRCFSLLPALSEETISVLSMTGEHMAAISTSPDGLYAVILVNNLEIPTPVVAQDICLDPGVRPTAIAIIDGISTTHGRMEVLLGSPERSIIVISSDCEAIDLKLDKLLGSVPILISVSPQRNYLAILGEDGVLTIHDTAFDSRILEFETKATTQPEQLLWCGEDAIVIAWAEKGILLVGPQGDTLKYPYEDSTAFRCVEDVDCVRIITQEYHELVQTVPRSLFKIRTIGSTAPAAILTDASHAFHEGDAKCDDSIRALLEEESMIEAIADCIDAATHEWEPLEQQSLLRAASYGKSFEPSLIRDSFTDSCRTIRILNTLRDSSIGIPMTIGQYRNVTAPVIVDRLMRRHEHRLALLICDYLQLNTIKDKVLVHWACAKVQSSARKGIADEEVRDLLREKLAGVVSVSYADIAATADAAGRRKLATMLLEFEPRAADQVPILLRMRVGRLALEKALDSGDTDLIYSALLHIRRSLRSGNEIGFASSTTTSGSNSSSNSNSGAGGSNANNNNNGDDDDGVIGPLDSDDKDASFIRAILAYPTAVDLLAAWAANQDPDLLLKLQLAGGRYIDAGRTLITAAYASSDLKERVTGLKRAAEVFHEGEKHPKLSSTLKAQCAYMAKATEEQVTLIISQVQLESDLDDKDLLLGEDDDDEEVDEDETGDGDSVSEGKKRIIGSGSGSGSGSSVGAGGGGGGGGDNSSVTSKTSTIASSIVSGTRGVRVLDKPMSVMLFYLLLIGGDVWSKRVDKIVKDFRVSEQLVAFLKVRAFASRREWNALNAFATEKKTPIIGFKYFAEACIAAKSVVEAKKYILKMSSEKEYEDKITLLTSIGAIAEAIEVALKAKDADRIINQLSPLAITPVQKDALQKAFDELGIE